MKKLFFGVCIAITTVSCSEAETKTETLSEDQKKEVIKLENVTNDVIEGNEKMTKDIDALESEVDDLLNEI